MKGQQIFTPILSGVIIILLTILAAGAFVAQNGLKEVMPWGFTTMTGKCIVSVTAAAAGSWAVKNLFLFFKEDEVVT